MKRTSLWLLLTLPALSAVAAETPAPMPMQFNGEIRLRPEYRGNPDFNKATSDAAAFVTGDVLLVDGGLGM